MRGKIWAAVAAGVAAIAIMIACGDDDVTDRAPPQASATPTATGSNCPPATKPCADRCVSIAEPATGCAAESCAPCALAHASASCGGASSGGACSVSACENGWGDCNAAPSDGCETSLATTSAHCGACRHACAADQVCRASSCVPRAVADAEAWLSTQTEGFCLDEYNKMLNLCGDVDFCFDQRFMRTYPNGVAVDVGVAWEGEFGTLVALGGDCDGKSLLLGTGATDGGTTSELHGFAFTRHLQTPFTVGKHLISLQVNALGAALYVDGLKVSTAGPPPYRQLLDACGPGMIIGQRISYWWEAATHAPWNRMAVFLVHLRENIADTAIYSVATATTPHADTLYLFDRTTGVSGSRWTARVGGLVAVGKNAQNEDPQLDAGASGPLPTWKSLAQCALK